MIPIGVVIAAPLPVILHSVDIATNLAAFISEAVCIAVNLGAIGLETAVTIVPPVPIRTSCAAGSEKQAARQRGSQDETAPGFFVNHG